MKTKEVLSEIRDFGDKETIVLYTNDNLIYQALRLKAIKEVAYETWKDASPENAKRVAVDLYFSLKSRKTVEKLVTNIQKTGKKYLKTKTFQRMYENL